MTIRLVLATLGIALMTMVIVDAAANQQQENTRADKRDQPLRKATSKPARSKHSNNPHALLASDERFSSCGNPSKDVFRIESVSSNRHLCSGCKACVDLEGILKGRIEKGSMVRLEVTKYFVTVFDKIYDLCDVLETDPEGPKCPIEPTAEGLRACLPLDKSLTTDVVAGIRVTGITSSRRPLFCIEGSAMVESNCPREVGPGSYACNH